MKYIWNRLKIYFLLRRATYRFFCISAVWSKLLEKVIEFPVQEVHRVSQGSSRGKGRKGGRAEGQKGTGCFSRTRFEELYGVFDTIPSCSSFFAPDATFVASLISYAARLIGNKHYPKRASPTISNVPVQCSGVSKL
jgi:hypothetical protein